LRAEKIGFAAAEAASTNQSFGLHITVAAGEAVKDVEIKFRPAGAITGRVLNEDGEPMANVTVQAMRYAYIGGKRRLNPEGQAQTNDLGEYRIFNLLPKKYYVRASVSNAEGFSLLAKRQSNKPAQAYWARVLSGRKNSRHRDSP
jgi:protocatechuate 3,4-dioxygenase beta subunit